MLVLIHPQNDWLGSWENRLRDELRQKRLPRSSRADQEKITECPSWLRERKTLLQTGADFINDVILPANIFFQPGQVLGDISLSEAAVIDGADYGRGVSKDVGEAARWYAKAAEQGQVDAQFRLGYFNEVSAAPPRFTDAAEWYRKAAEQNHAQAELLLGNLYFRGDGVTKDLGEVVGEVVEQGRRTGRRSSPM